MKIVNVQQNTPEWVAWRASSFGASDSAAILGHSSFKTAYQLFLESKGFVEGFKENNATRAGHNAEEKARASYEILHGDFETFTPLCVEHEQYNFIKASLDGYSNNLKRILEIKYPSEESHNMALSGEIPKHYWIQVQHQFACVPEAIVAHYWSFRDGNGAMVEVSRDNSFINEILIPAIISFKVLVDSNTPPPLTEKDSKLMTCKESIELMTQIKLTENKEDKKDLAKKLIDLAGHPRVQTDLGRVTSVFKKGEFSYYKITTI